MINVAIVQGTFDFCLRCSKAERAKSTTTSTSVNFVVKVPHFAPVEFCLISTKIQWKDGETQWPKQFEINS